MCQNNPNPNFTLLKHAELQFYGDAGAVIKAAVSPLQHRWKESLEVGKLDLFYPNF